ncbi:MAG: phosphoglucomutase/phosphomannomutase family protein [Chitinophagales bacterium]|nr:phosphoglucomutase/phosphomannomutase family protein [Chitinophagales bacterium]
MIDIKFGTDGWRAIIAQEFTVENVARVAEATAKWVLENANEPRVVLGFDTRFAGALFAETTLNVLCSHGIKVIYDKNFVSTPMISLAAFKLKCFAGIIITASHNPPSYSGYKLKSYYGGPSVPASIAKVESLIEDKPTPYVTKSLEEWQKDGLLEFRNLEDLYFEEVASKFDLNAIKNSKLNVAYDAMYGAGQKVFNRILPDATMLHADYNPSFKGQAPEPLHRNLTELSELIRKGDFHIGVATDGDADRIGMYDDNGDFIDAHHIILLLIHILHKYKGMNGKVVIAFSVSNKVVQLCKAYNLDYEITKIGFKYISGIMVDEDVLVGGEESGGIAVKGHIPERDGIWDALVILEQLAKSGKTIRDLINEIYDVVGPFSYNRSDLHITEELKKSIMLKCEKKEFKKFGVFDVLSSEDVDGYKFFLGDNGETVMIRPSGTEPVLRVYAEGPSPAKVQEILQSAKDTLLA